MDNVQQRFTDEDFQYSAAQFDVDFLEQISCDSGNQNALTRESLYVKFDPLVGKNSPRSATVHVANKINILDKSSPLIKSSLDDQSTVRSDSNVVCPTEISSESQAILALPSKKMFTEDDVAEMVLTVRKKEIEVAQRKYAPKIAILKEQLAVLQFEIGQFDIDSKLSTSLRCSKDDYYDQEISKWRKLISAHESFEHKIVDIHEELKQKYKQLVVQRDTTLKTVKFIENSFDELRQRYKKLQETTRKLYKSQEGVPHLEGRNRQVSGHLNCLEEECQKKQDEANLSYESLKKELGSKLAVEKVQIKKSELQVLSINRDIQLKEQEKAQLTQLCEDLMKELGNTQ